MFYLLLFIPHKSICDTISNKTNLNFKFGQIEEEFWSQIEN